MEKGDDLGDVIEEYSKPYIKPGDMIFLSEKIVAISQGRAFHINDIKPRPLARFLVKFVTKTPAGIGLGSPYTMELALRDVGVARILLGCAAAAVTKPFGVRGVFYRVCGTRARAIDGPAPYVIPPYNNYAKMAPKDPDKVCARLKERLGHDVFVIDANDLGVNILGRSTREYPDAFLCALFKDNPLGQTTQQTPMALVRKA